MGAGFFLVFVQESDFSIFENFSRNNGKSRNLFPNQICIGMGLNGRNPGTVSPDSRHNISFVKSFSFHEVKMGAKTCL